MDAKGDAADFAGVAPAESVDAIAARELGATTTHRQRPGDTLVRMLDVELWRCRRAA